MDKFTYTISDSNIHIYDSYRVSKHNFREALDIIESENPENPVLVNRSKTGMILEWTTHNFLYSIGIEKERTDSVDLNYPQKWWVSAAYSICGVLTWLFVK